jgi:hypothetical protein
MSEETHRVLDLLAQGKINVSEAEQLLQALNGSGSAEKKTDSEDPKSSSSDGEKKAKPRFLHVQVESVPGTGRQHNPVNIRVPLGFLRSGIKLAAVMPDDIRARVTQRLREKGIDVDLAKMKPADMDALVSSLSDLSVDVDSDKEKVRIFCD